MVPFFVFEEMVGKTIVGGGPGMSACSIKVEGAEARPAIVGGRAKPRVLEDLRFSAEAYVISMGSPKGLIQGNVSSYNAQA